jgi:hypothetical protein
MNYSSYLMRDQAHDLIADLDRIGNGRRRGSRIRRLRSFLEVGAFVAALASYLIALSLMA